MSEVLAFEIRFFFETIMTGFLLGMVYGVFLVCRNIFRHGKVWTAAEDLFYWIFCLGVTAWLFYNKTDGNIRIYAVFGLSSGMVLCRKAGNAIKYQMRRKTSGKKRKK